MGYHSIDELLARGIRLPIPSAAYVGDAVDLDRIAPGVVLHPGVRIEGRRTVLAGGVEIGTHGPVVLTDAALGRGSKIASGAVDGAVLLAGAALGPDSHVRPGTLLEEGSSTAHAVGLKQTVVLAFGTLGSNINFCDCLLAGGRSRKDHSEVGSGFIHFNFTPFGPQGDKATASLFGDVPRGVLLREDRIFLGGSGGVVGPIEIGFGTILAAGSVYRRDYASGKLVVGEAHEPRVLDVDAKLVRRTAEKVRRSLRYVGNLIALDLWYRDVRLPAAVDVFEKLVLEAARGAIAEGVKERLDQVDRLFENRAAAGGLLDEDEARFGNAKAAILAGAIRDAHPCPEAIHRLWTPTADFPSFVRGLTDEAASHVTTWLSAVVTACETA